MFSSGAKSDQQVALQVGVVGIVSTVIEITTMALPTLQSLCQQQMMESMRMGRWDNCSENPFRSMPTKIVNILMDCLYSLPHTHFLKIEDSLLLLTSGKIKQLDFRYFKNNEFNEYDPDDFFCKDICATYNVLYNKVKYNQSERYYKRAKIHHANDDQATDDILLHMVSKDSCQNIRTFILPPYWCFDASTITSLIQTSPNLEEIHASSGFEFEVLRNRQELRNLRLHLDILKFFGDQPEAMVGILASIKNLEIFALFAALRNPHEYFKLIAKVLMVCPNITSLGLVDSSFALHHIHKEKETPIQFKLQKCFWGVCRRTRTLFQKVPFNIPAYRDSSEFIRNSVELCPLVEELALQVFDKPNIRYLSHLKHLTTLELDFIHWKTFSMDFLLALLSEIGSQIKHLSLDVNDPLYTEGHEIYIDGIFKLCVNLETLKVIGISRVHKNVEACDSLSCLKRLCLGDTDNNCLAFLLQNCPNLEEMFLTQMLRGNLLEEILRQYPPLNLKIIYLHRIIPRENIKIILQNAKNLEKVCIPHDNDHLRELYPDVVVDENLRNLEYFEHRFHNCVF
ncbi:uncharacterized protein CDAR_95931 [Caerostris darwini]|uniref:Uncharacterized protein n=1 Tax=Caerostris darwini TaxID=1538125 RepID=A0AAV4UPZ4_9ARAC|nr:uncharacterized protein CDAR_95931 [Caerostris darwini]